MSAFLLWCSISLSVHKKPSSSKQFVKDKSRDLQILLRYLGGIVTSTFKVGKGSYVAWSVSPGFLGCGGLSGVSLTIFDYNIFQKIIHMHYYIKIFRIVYQCVVNF